MNIPASQEERQFLDLLFETYLEMRKEKKLSHIHEADLCNLEKHNIKRDEKKKANPSLLTLRRKCATTGINMIELLIKTEEKMKARNKKK